MDYVELAEVAEALIAETGRVVTINRFSQTAADPTKPWRGPTDPSAVPDATDTVAATFVAPGSLGKKIKDEDLLKRCDQVCLVAGTASFDLATANEVVDGEVHWRILFVEKCAPGNTALLYIIGVAR